MGLEDVVLPGDIIEEPSNIATINKKVILGPGLRKQNENIISTKCGLLKSKKPNTFWVDSFQKRYVPCRGETIVGVVTIKAGDNFRIDIGGSEFASLSYLAFEGATKKNRPDVNVGDLVFAKILIANRDLEPELICVDAHGKKGKLGVLTDGFAFNCSINLVRKILNEKCPLIKALSKEVPFEMAAGMNGKIWIKAKTVKETIAVGNAILSVEHISESEIVQMCDHIGKILVGYI